MSEAIYPIETLQESTPEKYKLGEVKGVREAHFTEFDIPEDLAPGAVYSVDVEDPYLEKVEPILASAIKMQEDQADAFARERRLAGKWQRQAGTAYIDSEGNQRDKRIRWGDPVAHESFFGQLNSTALKMWLSHIPSANALTYLSDPENVQSIIHRNGKFSAEVDDVARTWLTVCSDAVAIRNRGAIMAELVKEYVGERPQADTSRQDALKWMSIACGTALPAMKAALNAGLEPDLLLVDIDKSALDSTKALGDEIGFIGDLDQSTTNIFNTSDMAALRSYLGDNGNRPRIIDLMGIFEYTGEHTGIDPAEFLRSNYDMLHPGGRLILGQMRTDRPNPDFTMGVVGWPYIVMRSPSEVMRVIKQAGIPLEAARLYMPEDGVYTVCAIDKPTGEESFAS